MSQQTNRAVPVVMGAAMAVFGVGVAVEPDDDVQEIMFDVLRHRILLSFEAEASGVTPDTVLETIRERVPSA